MPSCINDKLLCRICVTPDSDVEVRLTVEVDAVWVRLTEEEAAVRLSFELALALTLDVFDDEEDISLLLEDEVEEFL